ncbi:SDR family oxidoreductase [Verticiella sediminum]|uniref:SDR family oxidoreductase n=1 Tax=Verticiella sediminum TaxID=1247510 RepID=A0A556AV11_9BURK|nr:SDR family oxidoreductase [Verticiella sediminum]TSH96781.1 SDR family oxidoreductase [Verticiella sediminum]
MGLLDGRCALITGAGSGFGKAGARTFAREGASVVVADIDAVNGEETAKRIRDAGGRAEYVLADVSRVDQIEWAVREAARTFGRLDIFWHNAGIAGPGAVEETSEHAYDLTMSVHLKAAFFGAKFVLEEMKKIGSGTILLTSSLAGLKASRASPVYGVAKAGLIALTRNLAAGFAPYQVRVNAICPGPAETPMWLSVTNRGADRPDLSRAASVAQMYRDKAPLRRLCEPQDVANAALFLASDLASCITGDVMSVDGGLSVV